MKPTVSEQYYRYTFRGVGETVTGRLAHIDYRGTGQPLPPGVLLPVLHIGHISR